MPVELQTAIIAAITSIIIAVASGLASAWKASRDQKDNKQIIAFDQCIELLNETQDERRELREIVNRLKTQMDDLKSRYDERMDAQAKEYDRRIKAQELEIAELRAKISVQAAEILVLQEQNTKLKVELEIYKKGDSK